jgi:hypothetical protein
VREIQRRSRLLSTMEASVDAADVDAGAVDEEADTTITSPTFTCQEDAADIITEDTITDHYSHLLT